MASPSESPDYSIPAFLSMGLYLTFLHSLTDPVRSISAEHEKEVFETSFF